MRPVRILLVAIALVAVALTGWAIGARGGGYAGPEASAAGDPAATTVLPQAEPAPPAGDPASGGTTDGTAPPRTNPPAPAPRPRIAGFGSEPVLPTDGGFWQLQPGASQLTLVLDAQHASRVEFWLTPTGTGAGDLAVKLGQDTNGRDGWLFNWHYPDEPILGHLTVKAIGPGGTAQEVVGVYHPDPAEQP